VPDDRHGGHDRGGGRDRAPARSGRAPDAARNRLGGTQAAGLWEFLRDAADSKQLHAAKAAADGLLAAYIARDGFTGASDILAGPQGMGAGLSTDAMPERLTDGLGRRWALTETSFKVHASCRHTHPAADALLALMQEHQLAPDDIRAVTAHVHQAAIDVLGAVTNPQTVHQSKFSMGFVLALIALHGHAALTDFTDATLADQRVRAFHDRVRMQLDPEIDHEYPRRWIGRVTVGLQDGRELERRVVSPKGDPDNTLSRDELVAKAVKLAEYSSGATAAETAALAERILRLRLEPEVRRLLPERRPSTQG
jgi:2-methylcitrate dehydratase PrpD